MVLGKYLWKWAGGGGKLMEGSPEMMGWDAEALWRDASVMQSFWETAPVALMVVDSAGHILLVNGKAEEIFGYQREELLGQAADMLVPQWL